jgi:hypothetical protein
MLRAKYHSFCPSGRSQQLLPFYVKDFNDFSWNKYAHPSQQYDLTVPQSVTTTPHHSDITDLTSQL